MENLIRILFNSEEAEEILGDIFQVYSEKQRKNRFTALIWYFSQISLLILSGFKQKLQWGFTTVVSSINLSLRSILKSRMNSLLNIMGLSISLACCMAIFLYVNYEMSYDHYNENGDRIYRLINHIKHSRLNLDAPITPAPLKDEICTNIPDIEKAARVFHDGSIQLKYGTRKYMEHKIAHVDKAFIDIFQLKIIKGANLLEKWDRALISRTLADKLFHNQNPVGKPLNINNGGNYIICGVFEDMPDNSHLKFNLLISLMDFPERLRNDWTNINFHTYIQLKKGTSPKQTALHFPHIIREKVTPSLVKLLDIRDVQTLKCSITLQPLFDIYLHSDYSHNIGELGNSNYVNIFIVTGFLILIIACINFMNLTTANLELKVKDTGIRKIMGANRLSIILLSFTETFIMVLLSVSAALLIVHLTLPVINELASKSLLTSNENFTAFVFFLISILLATALLAGIYPAITISSINPIKVLSRNSISRSSSLRKVLVVLQFSVSIILVTATLIINSQISYIKNRNIGFVKEHILIIENCFLLRNRAESFRKSFSSDPRIINSTSTSYLPISGRNRRFTVIRPEGRKNMLAQVWAVDHNYTKTFQIKVAKGRGFSKQFPSDKTAVLINQTAAKMIGWKNPVGKTMSGNILSPGKPFRIIGVVEDFNYESMKQKIGPLIMYPGKNSGNISFKIKTDNIEELISDIRTAWYKTAPDATFNYSFLDDSFNAMYKNEIKLGKVFSIFASMAILIGCLGLFGMASFLSQQKRAEIGIRKVLGSSTAKILILLTKEFTLLILIAFTLSVPVAYYAMDKWLAGFAYRADINPTVFLISGLGSLIIALLTVSYHTLKASNANPIKTLNQN